MEVAMIETSEMIERIKHEGKAALAKQKFNKENIGIYLEKLLSRENLLPKDAIKLLNLDPSYGRKIFSGSRKPTRTILLQFAFLLSLDLKETQRLLEIGERPILYPRIRFDSAIIYGIENKLTLEKVNEFLEELGENTLL